MKLDKKRVLGLSAAVLALVATPVVWAQIGSIQVIADGLNNPRGLTFGPAGVLYVAEAGSGGDGPCQEGEQGGQCYGATGAVTRINLKKGDVDRVVTGLPSLAGPGGVSATGPHDVSLQGAGNINVTIGYGGDPASRTATLGPVGALFARLARAQPNGKWSPQEDLGTYEAAVNPDGKQVDTNPYSVITVNGNKKIYIDAGGNSLNEIAANGKIKTLATFPTRLVSAPPLPPMVSVPMSGSSPGSRSRWMARTCTGCPLKAARRPCSLRASPPSSTSRSDPTAHCTFWN
jgi:hypothetical protein